jgi:hypothetical protein
MMHPHMAKLLADAQSDEMLATAERHRLRQLARRQGRRATNPTTDHPRHRTRPCPSILDLSTTSNADADEDLYLKA